MVYSDLELQSKIT